MPRSAKPDAKQNTLVHRRLQPDACDLAGNSVVWPGLALGIQDDLNILEMKMSSKICRIRYRKFN